MADVEKINVGGVAYNVCDPTARGNIPTKTSQLQNDSGFITSNDVPTKTSELVNDSGFTNLINYSAIFVANVSTNGWVKIATTNKKPSATKYGCASSGGLNAIRDARWNTNGDVEVYFLTSDNGSVFSINITG